MHRQNRTPWLAGILAGVFVILLFVVFAYVEEQRYREALRTQAIRQLSEVRAELESGINANFHLTRGLIAYISAYPAMDQATFHHIANSLLQHPNFIKNIGLAPNNRVEFVHPLPGNEGALGLKYEENAQQWPAIKKVIESGQTVIAGPVNLVQGGRAFISRTPIYFDSRGKQKYWGLASIVIDQQQLLTAAGFYNPELDISIALRGADGLGAAGDLIAGDPQIWHNNPALLAVTLPTGSWQLAAIPRGGWAQPSPYKNWIRRGGLVLSLLSCAWVFVWLQRQARTRAKIETALEQTRAAETQLQRANTVLTSQMEASLDGILVVDDEENILSFNQRFIEVWRVPDKIMQAKLDSKAIKYALSTVADPDAFLAKLQQLYRSKTEESRDRIELKDGRLLDRYSKPLIGPDGIYFGRIWYFRDITEQTRMETELHKTQKLESVGVLAGGIAHDFNNILAAILGNINLALRRLEGNERVHKLLLEAEKASIRAKSLTQQLLTFSKGGTPVKKVVALDEVIRDSADFVLRGTNVRCEFDFADDLFPCEVDPGQIGQAIQNIVLNAAQAMPEGGIVAISCRNTKMTDEPPQLQPGPSLKIIIQDSGKGIPRDQLDRIFDPYYSTKQTGNGLGLAITHSIINKHNGHIQVTSIIGQGTSFTIYLPASPELKIESVSETTVTGNVCGRILLMDDDEMLRQVTGEMLSDEGFQVLHAATGEEALKIYQQTDQPIDLVIMDLTIPGGMGGKEAVQQLLQIDPKAKAIVSSGYSQNPIMANYRDFGFYGAIEKPYRWQELKELLDQLL